jgi:putative DNA methylase
MTPKRMLIEVALPLDSINSGCEEDKNRKVGHIRNLHKWFAPMPLPAWRAILLASVIEDPSNTMPSELAAKERERLFRVIASVSPLDSIENIQVLNQARDAVRIATHEKLPTVVDPFCGGGSTIVEAQRLGFPAIAADLNPVPVVITTALCRSPQLFKDQWAINPETRSNPTLSLKGLGALLTDVRYYANVVRSRAWQTLAPYYPAAENGEQIFAWRWAWGVRSPNPAAQGALTPLVTDWTLSRSERESVSVVPTVVGQDIQFCAKSSAEIPAPTAGGNSARCLFTNAPITFDYIRSQAKQALLRPQMFVMLAEQKRKKVFLPPSNAQIEAALEKCDLDLPDAALPEKALGFRVQGYGVKRFSDLFLPRQARSAETFSRTVACVHDDILQDALRAGASADPTPLEDGGQGARAYADAITAILGLCVDRLAASNNVLVQWFGRPSGFGKATPAFRMQTVSMVWDFVETNPFAESVGGWSGPVVESALEAFRLVAEDASPAQVFQSDAREISPHLPAHCLVVTDPPYYDNIGYADLSDFFYIWLRRCLREAFPKTFATVVTPKSAELIAAPYRHGEDEDAANEYFRSGFRDVFRSLAERTGGVYPLSIIYAIKQQEGKRGRGSGWEVFLDGLVEAGLCIVATWPIRTTTLTRTRGLKSNALASAICVTCRPRTSNAARVSRREFLTELRREIHEALIQFQAANIAPVDLAQAAVGRGMSVFSKFQRVLESDGSGMTVGTALNIINQILDEVLAEQEGDFDAGTRWALAWFEQSGFGEGEYGLAETLSKAKNTSVSVLQHSGILKSKAGKVRLLRPEDLSPDRNLLSDAQLTIWEAVHHLVRRLEKDGETGAAELIVLLGGMAETARELAYRLYTICERKKRAQEALSYNALVQSWPEISRLARESGTPKATQTQMFEQA